MAKFVWVVMLVMTLGVSLLSFRGVGADRVVVKSHSLRAGSSGNGGGSSYYRGGGGGHGWGK